MAQACCNGAESEMSEAEVRELDQQVTAMRDRAPFPVPDDEVERLLALRRMRILDTDSELDFDRLTTLASRMFGCEIALVSLVDLNRQWFKSRAGLDATETPRDQAFCTYAICEDPDIFVVLDAAKDPRFACNPLVTGPPHIRFYAGARLKDRIGTLCIIDSEPRTAFSIEEKQHLLDLAALVSEELGRRVEAREDALRAKHRYISTTAHDLRTPLTSFQLALDLLGSSGLDDEQASVLDQARISAELMELTLDKAAAIATESDVFGDHDDTTDDDKDTPARGVSRESVRPAEVARRCGRVLEAFPKSVPVSYVTDDDAPDVVCTDGTLVWQCALNLLTNACAATHEGSIECRFGLPTHALLAGGLRVTVTDTGMGIDPSVQRLLFRPFTQARSAQHGTGLGLYSVQQSVRRLGGRCGGGNRENGAQGACFWIEVPALSEEEEVGEGNGEPGRREGMFCTAPQHQPSIAEEPPRPRSRVRKRLDEARRTDEELSSGEGGQKRTLPAGPADEATRKEQQPSHSEQGQSQPQQGQSDQVMQQQPQQAQQAPQTMQQPLSTSPIGSQANAAAVSLPTLSEGPTPGQAHSQSQPIPHVLAGVTTVPGGGSVPISGLQPPSVPGVTAGGSAPLPLAPGQCISAQGSLHGTSAPSSPRSGEQLATLATEAAPRALVVDDSAMIRRMLARLLHRQGFRVATARNGRFGLQAMKEVCFDVVCMDFLMPIMNGIEATRRYREWERTVLDAVPGEGEAEPPPQSAEGVAASQRTRSLVVGISANAEWEDSEAGLAAGMDAFCRKPVDREQLAPLLGRGLAQAEEAGRGVRL